MTDLEIIKKYYGDKMMHLCRMLFATLLETDGLLSKLMLDNFAPSKFIYDDIMESQKEEEFKNYIYSKVDVEEKKIIVNKTPKELLSDAGYDLYECKTEEDIQFFKKYYAKNEELCTFNGDRLKRCHVFFAVKKNVDEIKRENFLNPQRQDEYGTSVISIQFTHGDINTLSIKNRYNHTVNNPDATFSNNLENIILGLTESFEREYNLNINQNTSKVFEIPGYVKANDGRYYKYNYEINNIYYCPDNIIIDNFEVIKDYQEKEKYIVIDYFILDLVNKKIELYDKRLDDSFINSLGNISKIEIYKDKQNKIISIYSSIEEPITLIINKANKIILYKNNNIETVEKSFMFFNNTLKELEMKNLRKLGSNFLYSNKKLENLYLPKVEQIGDNFISSNQIIKSAIFPSLLVVGNNFLVDNCLLENLYVPKLKKVGNFFMGSNENLKSLDCPSLEKINNCFLYANNKLKNIYAPNLIYIGNQFLYSNNSLEIINLPKLEEVGGEFLFQNKIIIDITMPNLKIVGPDFLIELNRIKKLSFPNLEKTSVGFLYNNTSLLELYVPKLKQVHYDFLYHNETLKQQIEEQLEKEENPKILSYKKI